MWCMFSNNYIEVAIVLTFSIKDRILVPFIIPSKNPTAVFILKKKNYISSTLFLLNCNISPHYMEAA